MNWSNKIATGKNHVLALTTKGKIYAWGKNSKGQLGIGSKGDKKSLPTRLDIPEDISDIFAGDCISMAIWTPQMNKDRKDKRKIYSWGWNKYNKLFANKKHAKADIIICPTEIKLDVLKLGAPMDHDTNTYDMMFNLNSHDLNTMAFNIENNKVNQLHQNDRRIEQLSLENYKLK